ALWSLAAEQEASAHMRPRAVAPALIRERFGLVLTPSGSDAERFLETKGADRQILADAVAAGARFLVTEDVDDYGQRDLDGVGISAINPDLFLAERLTRDAYATVIDLFVERQVNPPTTAARFHAAIAKNHPRLFSAYADLYETAPDQSLHPEPAVLFRGPRCMRCEQIVADVDTIVAGLCPECR
ncbi:MAG: hypothetical protein QM622_05720, partial [Microbacterium sp.]